jgi:hypothetical protein
MMENVDRRILGAFRCLDPVLQITIAEGMTVESAALDIRRSGSGFYVVFDASGMHLLTTQFEVTGSWPPASSFEVFVRPASTQYLPRRVQVKVPRKLAPMSDPQSVMVPQDVPVYRAPAAPTSPNWAVIRASVSQANSGGGLPWAVLQVTNDSDHSILANAVTDSRGEALIAVPGIGVTANPSGGGAVLNATISATATAYFDPAVKDRPADWIPDPDDILNNTANPALKTAAQSVSLGRGTSTSLNLKITV